RGKHSASKRERGTVRHCRTDRGAVGTRPYTGRTAFIATDFGTPKNKEAEEENETNKDELPTVTHKGNGTDCAYKNTQRERDRLWQISKPKCDNNDALYGRRAIEEEQFF
ncbi:hypothetical protein CHS0354_002990, partial [Potamilus streckersoni]